MAIPSDEITTQPAPGIQEALGQPLPMSQPPLPDETLAIPEVGLGRMPQPGKRVIVLGGGIAGLVAAFELRRQGHEPLILEAGGRVGGRVRTIRDFAPGLYGEAGAMRIPRVHDLTLAYCELFGLELRPFVTSNPRALMHFNGARMTVAEADAHPERLPFALSETERGKSWTQLWNEATSEVRERYASGGDEAVEDLLGEYDRYSIGEFLAARGFSEGAIELYRLMSFRESNIEGRVADELREAIGGSSGDMQEIVGGFDQLPNAFYDYLRPNVRFGARVTAIGQSPDDVTVHYQGPAGRFTVHGDYAICTLPFSVLREVEVPGGTFSPEKQKAIRELSYNASTKILFGVRHRFWEREDGIVGGTTVTDLPIRRMVYPSFSDPEDERGTLLASYTWGGDASRGATDAESAIEWALEDVAQIHPSVTDAFEVGAVHAWYTDPYARGAFAMVDPQGPARLQASIVAPEGRIHFAGEHTSVYHAWIQGALESGIRAAKEVHEAPEAFGARREG